MIKTCLWGVICFFFLTRATVLNGQTTTADFIPGVSIENVLKNPFRLAIDQSDNIYVTDAFQKCIRKFQSNGTLLSTLAPNSFPISIAIDPDGVLFYGDGETGSVYKVNSSGQSELFYSGSVYPSSLAFSPDHILYLADNQLKKVLAIDLSGNLVGEIGTGTLIFPTGVAFDVKNNRILVAEHGGIGENYSGCGGSMGSGPLVKVYLYSRNGVLQGSFGCFGNTNGKFYRAQGINVGRCGNIYLCEPFQGNINVYKENGTYITKFGEYGTGSGQLNLPMDIAFDSQERIIIANYNNGSLMTYTINDPLPSAAITTPDIATCLGTPATISVRLTGTPPWSITYTRNGANPVTLSGITASPFSFPVSEAGVYVITAVSDASATGTCYSGAAQVSYHPLPTSMIPGGDKHICAGDTAIIQVMFTGDGPWTFTYTRNGVDPKTITTTNNPYSLEVTEQGNYSITALSGRGCQGEVFTGSCMVTVRPRPTAAFTSGNSRFIKCGEDAVMLPVALSGNSPWTFTYLVDEANPVQVQTSENPYFINARAHGSYEISMVNDNYCSGGAGEGYPEVLVFAKPTAEPLVSSLGICPGSTGRIPIRFTGVAPWTLTVTRDGGGTDVITTSENPYHYPVSLEGTYRFIAVTDSLCSSVMQNGVATVSNEPLPTASFQEAIVPLCPNQSANIVINFTGTAPWQFVILKNNTDTILGSSQSPSYTLETTAIGEYRMIALADANCTATAMPGPVTVVNGDPVIADFKYKFKNLRVQFTNTSSNAGSYLWEFGDNTTSTSNSPTHVYATPGIYEVTLTAYGRNCGYRTKTTEINLGSAPINTRVETVPENTEPGSGELKIKVYPNPANGVFTVVADGLGEEKVFVEVMNMAGQQVPVRKLRESAGTKETGEYSCQLDIRPCARGSYLIRLRSGPRIGYKMIIVTGE